ncbi:hypothetical protein L484_003099 [Morus notabilis]|uniref:Uncharacterized protein n=1 Tax=Morus notabilis TaxID=981085 RepID=W9RA81_9ROSA|nr:hypothetical protein L484_003099 [Morus notabilis]
MAQLIIINIAVDLQLGRSRYGACYTTPTGSEWRYGSALVRTSSGPHCVSAHDPLPPNYQSPRGSHSSSACPRVSLGTHRPSSSAIPVATCG